MREEKLEELKRYVNELKWFKKEIIKTNSSFIKVIPQDFYLNNGAVIRREQVMKNGKDGSAVIIVPKVGNEFLMTIEPRVFTEKRIAVSFPAGYIEKDETPKKAAARELKEETGIIYNLDELDELFLLEYYQKQYHTRRDTIENRLIKTYFYYGHFKGLNEQEMKRTEREIQGNFNLELMTFDRLQRRITETCNDPRDIFFNREMDTAIKVYKKVLK